MPLPQPHRKEDRFPVPENLDVEVLLKDHDGGVLARGRPMDVSGEGMGLLLDTPRSPAEHDPGLVDEVATVVFIEAGEPQMEILAKGAHLSETAEGTLKLGLEFMDWPPQWLLDAAVQAARDDATTAGEP
ncbi:hypothetical protein AN478_07350 [Thiohalorhabdus denitrificans]|uniref:PilZ domain-containing protein n=1 Tax=Thiohalorhabdus denitrificans TaxID=381306 RepID=A0A0P9EN98_9GAMM|nr:PilZ domain-containing protein [Thiohalorhabdus denitrificans]KPV39990.1 hypothetical protein AN478_07350 [Thiohalorhabdus denitrificans]SCY11218.1 hypothetical protein SAMN05661077_1236 [Thiohalorhabdus denitrificans]